MGELVLSGVSRTFGRAAAVRDVSFRVPHGSAFALLGPNGAGKTTTMRMILGILAPDAGRVQWNGAPVDERVRRRFGYLPEERGLYGKLTVRRHIAYFGRLHGLSRTDARTRTDAWIERLGLGAAAHRRCSELSKGNQQKVQFACAVLHDPELLVLDEPFSGLDPVNAGLLADVLREQRAQGATLILSSHQMLQIDDLCDAVCIIAGGSVRTAGALDDLRAAWPTRVVEVAPASAALRTVLAQIPASRALAAPPGALAYEVPAAVDAAALLRALVAAGAVTRFAPVEPSLRDIYLKATEAAA